MNIFGFNIDDLRLLINLFKMNLRDRYLGSSFGSIWAILNPVFMLSLFTYVFGFVLKIKIPGAETTLDYVIWLISGYGPWIATTDAIMAGAISVVSASGLVKNMTFKTELLPIASSLIGLVGLIVSLIFLFLLFVWSGKNITLHVIMLPIVIVIQFVWLIALAMWLSLITVFVRDTIQILPNLLMATLFATPILYPFENMPRIIQLISYGNPFYHIAESYRAITLGNKIPSLWGLLFVVLLSTILLYFGLKIFRRAKSHFDSAL